MEKKFVGGDVLEKSDGSSAVRVAWRDGAMTTAPLFDRLALDLAARSHGPAGPAALARFAAAGVDTAGHADPVALALACRAHPRSPWARTTVSRLATVVPGDATATLTVLLAMRPALLRLVRRLLRHGVDSDDAVALVVGQAFEVLADPSLAARPDVARWIVRDTWCRCWTRCRRDRRFEDRWNDGPAGDAALRSAEAAAVEPVIDAVLERAVRTGVLRPRHARLLYETRGLGRPLGDVAAEWGVDAGALASLRRRAERRLRDHLLTEAAQ